MNKATVRHRLMFLGNGNFRASDYRPVVVVFRRRQRRRRTDHDEQRNIFVRVPMPVGVLMRVNVTL
jgi:hypothetical protein